MDGLFWQTVVRRVRFSLVALALVVGVSAVPARGQTYLQSVGVPPFATELPVENGFVNIANGSLHLEIPLGSFPQRTGSPDKIVLMYDSDIWSSSSGTWQPNNIINPSNDSSSWGGWRPVLSRDSGNVSFGETDSGYCPATDYYSTATYYPWIWTAPDGTQHSFSVTTVAPISPGTCSSVSTPNASGYATDGSGFFISITNYTYAVVYAPDGTKLCDFEVCANGYASGDANGNYAMKAFSNSNGIYTVTFTDTLGRTVLTEQNTTGSTEWTFTVPNAQGGTSTYTATTETIPTDTNFDQYGITECSSCFITVVQSIQLPDGTSYSYTYDPESYGLLTSMTLPTGYEVKYAFSNFQDSVGNMYRSLTYRSSTDGTFDWIYEPSSTACVNGVCLQYNTYTKPSGDQEQFTFFVNAGAWPIQIQYYSGASNLLATTVQCWSFTTLTSGTCSYNARPTTSTDIQLLGRTTTLPVPGGSVSATTAYIWDHDNQGIFGEMTGVEEYNFGNSPANGVPSRTTGIGYVSDSNQSYVTANILNRPSIVTSGGAQTLYSYDGANLTSVTGMPDHDDANYGTNTTVRGNVTLVQQLVGGSNYLNSSASYDTTGQPLTLTDPNGAQSTLSYTCANGYPTEITVPLLSAPIQVGFNCNTGLLTSITDPNSQTTGFSYDSMARPVTTSYPDGGRTTLSYDYSGSTLTGSTATQKITSSQNLVTINNTDGLGRVTSSITTSDPDGPTTVSTVYDTNGRILKVSNPYRSTSDPTYGFETNSGYDGLDRITQITHVDGHISSIYYGTAVTSPGGLGSQLCAASMYGVGFPILTIDEANNKLQSWIDGFGRTIEVDEPTATSNTLSANTCYSYDLDNDLTGVLSAGGAQSRSYAYDGVSRLISKTDPESGTTSYTWDSDSTMCGLGAYSSYGDMVKTIDADGHCINRKYDALHRLTDVGSSTGCQRFRYDNTSGILGSLPSGLSITNPYGRLVEAETDTCAWPVTQSSIITDQWSSFDPMGRTLLNTQCTVAYQNCGTTSYSSLNYGYDLLGDMTSYTNGAGVTITQSPFSGAGRLTSVTSSLSDSNHPGTLLSSVTYNALGETASATLGNGATETFGYAPRGWPSTAIVSSQAQVISQATPGSGTVTINGTEEYVTTGCPRCRIVIVYDSGTVSVGVNGTYASTTYGEGSTAAGIASQLASSINGFGFVTASVGGANGNVIYITSTTSGASTNYSLSGSSTSNDPTNFTPPSFTTSSGASLTGGANEVIQPSGTLYSFSLAYGAGNANVTSANDSVNGNWLFTYDYLNRLSTSNQNSGQEAFSYGYDQLGNRTSQTQTAGSCCGNLSLSYAGNNNQMNGYSYDAAGNLLGDGSHTYAYDAENRLVSVDGGTTASYVYDAEGRRVQKTAGAQVEYLYDLYGNIVTELNSAGSVNREEIFANGAHLATYNNSTTYFDHADGLGTERARSSMSDADCEAITSLPFGDWQSTSGACADASPLHFTGQQRDLETNLDYFGARHYSSQFGRFMSPDPTGIFLGNLNDPQSLNLYAYVRNNPLNSTDPTGLDDCDDFGDCGGCDDFCIGIGIGIGFGGGGGGRGPQPPLYIPPDSGLSPYPNGTSASDDPFGGETNGIALQDWSENFAQGDAAKQWFQKWWTLLTGLAWKPPQSRPPIRVGGPKPGNYPPNRGPQPPKEGPGPTEDGSPQVKLPDPEDIPSGEALNKLPLWRLIGYIIMREVGGIQDVFVPVVILPRNGCYPGTPCMPNGPVIQ